MKEKIIGIACGLLIGYLFGTISPAALIGKLKKRNSTIIWLLFCSENATFRT